MNKYLLKLLDEGTINDCKIIKKVIDARILEYEVVINSVIETKNPRIIYKTALNTAKENDIPRLADAICETNDALHIYYFAIDVIYAPIDKLADAICKTNNANYIYKFAYMVDGAPIDKLADAICQTDHDVYIKDFILNIKKINKNSKNNLVDALIRLKSIKGLEEIINANTIKNETDILNKIKYGLLECQSSIIKYQSLINTANNGSDDLKFFSEIYKELLGVNDKKGKLKIKELKSE